MLYFLYGENALDSGEKVKAIKEKFLSQDTAGAGLSVFPAQNNVGGGYEGVVNAIGTPNLLAPKRLILINDLLSGGKDEQQENILEFLKKEKYLIDDQDTVVVFWEKGKVKKGNELFKWLLKNAKSQEFEKPVGAKLNQWILKKAKAIDEQAKISSNALDKLIFYAGGDLFPLSNEISKLINYAGGKEVSEEMVDLLVQADFDANIFNTIDALGNRNKKDALKFLHQHLKKGEDPFYIFSMFVYQFRNLLKIADLKENYQMNEQEIARETKLHPFVVRKGLSQARNFSLENIKKIYQKLSNLDVKIKTGKIDIKLALDKFIVEI